MNDTLRADGAVFADSEDNSTADSAAIDFGSVKDEYCALRTGVGVAWLGEAGYVEMSGRERGEFLNRLATNRLDQIAVGQGKEAFLCDAPGRIIEHVLVFAEADRLVVRTAPGRGPHLFAHLDYYLIREDVRLVDRSREWHELLVAGPEADEALAELAPVAVPQSRLEHTSIPWWGASVAVRRLTGAHFPSFILTAPRDLLPDLWRTLRNAGAAACGLAAWDTVRIEEGWPQFGQDITEKTIPQEVGRNEQAICFDKGCYIGQETVAKVDSRDGVQQLLCGVVVQSASVPAGGAELIHAGLPAGRVTSARWSPGKQAVVALANLRRDYAAPGTELSLAGNLARVVPLPM